MAAILTAPGHQPMRPCQRIIDVVSKEPGTSLQHIVWSDTIGFHVIVSLMTVAIFCPQ